MITSSFATVCGRYWTPSPIWNAWERPGMSGVDATRQIVSSSPQIRVLVVTMFEHDHLVFSAMRAGARGYLLKGARHEDMVRAIQAVGSGDAIFSPAIAARLVDYFA